MSRPHVICEACFEQQRTYWTSQSFLYCEHYRAVARRRGNEKRWTIDRRVTPQRAKALLDKALAKVAAYCRKEGISLEEGMELVQRQFQRGRQL